MEVFKIAKRLKPRRVYKVQAAHEVPPRPTAPGPSGSPASPGIGRQWGAVFTGLVAPMGIYLALTMAPQGAGPTGPGSTPGRSTSRTEVAQATKTTLDEKGTRTARSPGQLRAPSRPVIELDPSGKLLKDARRIVFRLRSDPTTQGNLKERLDMLEKLF